MTSLSYAGSQAPDLFLPLSPRLSHLNSSRTMKGKEGIIQSLGCEECFLSKDRRPPSCSCTLAWAEGPRPLTPPQRGYAGTACKHAVCGTLPHCPCEPWDRRAGPHPDRRTWLRRWRAREAHGHFTAVSSDLGKGHRCLFSRELSWRSRRCFQWRPTCIMLRNTRKPWLWTSALMTVSHASNKKAACEYL